MTTTLALAPSRVPAVTPAFWGIKLLAVTVGETFADFIIFNVGLGLKNAGILFTAILAIALFIQFKKKRYEPWIYWLNVVLVSILGTILTDYLVDDMAISLITTTIIFVIALASVFAAWFVSEKTLSIHSIRTAKREIFYWLAILLTFAFGTSLGDYLAETINAGYFNSFLIFATIIAIIFGLYKSNIIGPILAFWAAYIMTRPMGASLGDYLSQAKSAGGIGLGTVITSFIFLALIAVLIGYLTITKVDEIKA